MSGTTRTPLAALALLIASILWGSSFVALKLAFEAYHPMQVIFGRMFIASIFFLPYLKQFRQAKYKKGDWKLLLFMVLCEPCMYFIFESWAMTKTTAGQAGMITAMLPLMVAVGARLFLKEYITRKTMLGFAMAIAGSMWLSLTGEASLSAPNPMLGNFLEFMAMACAAGYMVACKPLTDRYSPLFITAMQAFGGTLFFFPLTMLPQVPWPHTFYLVPSLAVVFLGLCVTVAAYGMYNYGVSKLSASQASAFVNLIPVVAVVTGCLILDESFKPAQYLASALVLAGVFVSQDRGRPRATQKQAL